VRGRVVISGIGCVTSLGCSREAFTQALLAGDDGIRPITGFAITGLRATHAARIRDFDPTRYLPPLKLRRVDPVGRVAIAATRDALDHAGLPHRPEGYDDVGVVLGSYSAGVHATGEYLESLMKGGPTGAPALLFSSTVGNAPASQCGLEYGLRGPNTTLMHKEASGLSAIAFGTHLIRRGKAAGIVAGGADDIYEHFYRAHDWFGVMAPSNRSSRTSGDPAGNGDAGDRPTTAPFDAARNGFVMGEGGFMVVLEAEPHCAARGGQVFAEVLGVGTASASLPINAWPTDSRALVRTMRLALDDAGLLPDAVDAVYASANGTRLLDRHEAHALRELFGDRAVPVTSIKGALGEFAAAGAASLAAALLCGATRRLPPIANLRTLGDDCPVAAVRDAAAPLGSGSRQSPPIVHVGAPGTAPAAALPAGSQGPVILINSFASGGTNFSVVIRLPAA
jgi:3-oxoacyl-[acyl-carrier-protein] synthase II